MRHGYQHVSGLRLEGCTTMLRLAGGKLVECDVISDDRELDGSSAFIYMGYGVVVGAGTNRTKTALRV